MLCVMTEKQKKQTGECNEDGEGLRGEGVSGVSASRGTCGLSVNVHCVISV